MWPLSENHRADDAATLRTFLWTLLTAGIALGVIATLHYASQNHAARLSRQTEERAAVDSVHTGLSGAIEDAVTDLRILARHVEQTGQPGAPGVSPELTRIFVTFAEQKRCYDQIRYLDPQGRETLRVDLENGAAHIAPRSDLQDKSSRYYVAEARKLLAGETYISPLDLNVERGEIEFPHKPVMRFVTAVFDREQRAGIVAINYLGQYLFERMYDAGAAMRGQLHLLDPNGYWLRGPDQDANWGFVFGSNRTFAGRYPLAWPQIRSDDRGQFANEEGLFTFDTVLIQPSGRDSAAPAGADSSGEQQPAPGDYFFKIVSHIPNAEVGLSPQVFFGRYLGLYTSIFAILALLSLAFARARVRHRRAETQRELDALRLRGLFELSPVGIALNDYRTGAFLEVNDALLSSAGYTRDEFLALSYWDVTPASYGSQEEQQLESLKSTGRYGPYEKEYIRKDGSRYPVLLNGMVVRDPSGHEYIWSIVEDISERELLDRMRREFLAIAGHELRTPLTSISGALSLAVGGALGELPSRASHALGIAYKNSQRLAALIDELLDMDALLKGYIVLDKAVQPLGPLLEEVVETHRVNARAKGVSLVLGGRSDTAEVLVDAKRLKQALGNLISNAVKHSPDGANVEITVTRRDPHVRVTVTDQGPGVPAAFREHIFTAFAQADASDNRANEGTGLGLAITKALVERMGGVVNFDSTEGAGASFYLELPIASGDATVRI